MYNISKEFIEICVYMQFSICILVILLCDDYRTKTDYIDEKLLSSFVIVGLENVGNPAP